MEARPEGLRGEICRASRVRCTAKRRSQKPARFVRQNRWKKPYPSPQALSVPVHSHKCRYQWRRPIGGLPQSSSWTRLTPFCPAFLPGTTSLSFSLLSIPATTNTNPRTHPPSTTVIMVEVAAEPPAVDIEDPEFRRQLRKNYRELQQESTSALCGLALFHIRKAKKKKPHHHHIS
jgi:hypothetical protein